MPAPVIQGRGVSSSGPSLAGGLRTIGWLLLPPIDVPAEGRTIPLADGRTVNLYALHALHADEMTLKLDKGTDALLDAFDRAKVAEVLQPMRPSVARRKLFGLF